MAATFRAMFDSSDLYPRPLAEVLRDALASTERGEAPRWQGATKGQ